MSECTFELHHHAVKDLSPAEKSALHASLRAFASTHLSPLPNYQVLSPSPDALDDKIVTIARPSGSTDIAAFCSAFFYRVPGLDVPVLHTGLALVAPAYRRSGLIADLYGRLFFHVLALHPQGVWLSALAEVLSSLATLTFVAADVYPAPGITTPSAVHLEIAREVSRRMRAQMLIALDANLDEGAFVFRGSNATGEGRVFMKGGEDRSHWHWDEERNAYYRGLFRPGKGDEVLQVGFLDPKLLKRIARERYGAEGDKVFLSKL